MSVGSFDRDDVKVKGVRGGDSYEIDAIDDNGVERLAVDAKITGIEITAASVITANILRQDEIDINTKAETDLPNSTYTVPAGKVFGITMFGGSYDTQSPMYIRLKKQTGGTGPWETLFRVTLKQHGQDESNHQITLSHAIMVGDPGDVFKVTYESALSKGTLWAGYTGSEY